MIFYHGLEDVASFTDMKIALRNLQSIAGGVGLAQNQKAHTELRGTLKYGYLVVVLHVSQLKIIDGPNVFWPGCLVVFLGSAAKNQIGRLY